MPDKAIALRRAYVSGWKDKEPSDGQIPVEVTFSFRAEEAHYWPSNESAQRNCDLFRSYGVNVDWSEGGDYVCNEFQVEEVSPGRFVLFCEGPFVNKIPKIKGH